MNVLCGLDAHLGYEVPPSTPHVHGQAILAMYVRFCTAWTFFNRWVGCNTPFPATCALCIWQCILDSKCFLRVISTSLMFCELIGYIRMWSLRCTNIIWGVVFAFHLVDCCAIACQATLSRACGSSIWAITMRTLPACDCSEATGRSSRWCFSTYGIP